MWCGDARCVLSCDRSLGRSQTDMQIRTPVHHNHAPVTHTRTEPHTLTSPLPPPQKKQTTNPTLYTNNLSQKARERWRQFVNDNINLADNGITIPLPQVDAMFELGYVSFECMRVCVCMSIMNAPSSLFYITHTHISLTPTIAIIHTSPHLHTTQCPAGGGGRGVSHPRGAGQQQQRWERRGRRCPHRQDKEEGAMDGGARTLFHIGRGRTHPSAGAAGRQAGVRVCVFTYV